MKIFQANKTFQLDVEGQILAATFLYIHECFLINIYSTKDFEDLSSEGHLAWYISDPIFFKVEELFCVPFYLESIENDTQKNEIDIE